MSSTLWTNLITRTELLDDNILLLNSVPIELAQIILKKIQANNVIEETDVEYFGEKFDLKKNRILCIVETVSYLYTQLSKVILKPTDMKKFLMEHLGVEENKSKLLVDTWTKDIRNNFDLKNKRKLLNISWELNAQAASTLDMKEPSFNGTIQLKFADKRPADNIVMRLDEEEMLSLYNMLENIQRKLDII